MKELSCLLGICLLGCLGLSTSDGADEPPFSEIQRIAIDPDRIEFDTDVHFTFVDSDHGWAIWKGYLAGHDKVMARRFSIGKDGQINQGVVIEISGAAPGIFGLSLDIASLESDTGKIIASWSQRNKAGTWEIVRYPFFRSEGEQFPLTQTRVARGMRPNGGAGGLAWQDLQEQNKAVIQWQRNASQKKVEISGADGGRLSFHPVICPIDNSQVLCFWDEYKEGTRWIAAKEIHPREGEAIQISPPEPGTRCLNPVPLDSSGEGPCVAWIKLTDVIGGEGVIDMIHTAHVAYRTPDGSWAMVTDESGSGEGAVFLNGLLPDLRPGKGYPSGYSGNRRKPMLLDTGDEGVWMLWERKSKHSGGGTRTSGQLLGRRFQDGKWQEGPLLIYEGLIDYRLASPRKVRENGHSFFIIGSEIPHSWKRPSHLVEVDLRNRKPIELDNWRDQFKPVSLPFPEDERYTTKSNGTEYQLFWGDLHCHSGLTGDAEGEPDEIVLYGRDRAKLDVMVLQDNDEVHGRILTEGDYQMGVAHSQWITEPGRFVALPGYEWTQRTTLKGVPFPYRSIHEQKFSKGFPNHRTVIYPMSGGPIIRYFEVGHQFEVMADRVQAAGGILHSQHPAFHISDHPAETNLEVTACWGIYIRSVPAKFHAELDKGRRMGFIGTSDSHRRNPGLCGGLTGIYAEDLTPDSILDALKSHRVFATNGSRIVLDSRANDQLSDQVVSTDDGSVELSLQVRAATPIVNVRLIGTGGKTLARFEGDGTRTQKFTYTTKDLPKGKHWFYWAVEQEGSSKQYSGNISVARGNLAWSSPHFVEVK